MAIGDAFNSALDTANRGASNVANAFVDRPIYGTVAGGGFGMLGGEALERFLRKFEESDESYDPLDPEEIKKRKRRRIALIGAGLLAGGTTAALVQGDRSGFDQGVGHGLSTLLGSLFNKNWRHRSPEGMVHNSSQVYGPLTAPKSALPDPAHGTLWKTSSLADSDVAAFEKIASSLYFNSTIPLQQATYTMLNDPFLSASAKVGMAGLLHGSAQSAGNSLFSGADLARTAVRIGTGALEGYALGKIMGTAFALPDNHIKKLSRAGALADAVYSTGLFN